MHLRACLKKNPKTEETDTGYVPPKQPKPKTVFSTIPEDTTDPKEPPIQTTVPDTVETSTPTEHKEPINGTKNDPEEFTGFFV